MRPAGLAEVSMFALVRGSELLGYVGCILPCLSGVGFKFCLTNGDEVCPARSAWASGMFRVVEVQP